MAQLAFAVTDWVWCTGEGDLQSAGAHVSSGDRPSTVLRLPPAERRRLNPLTSFALRVAERLIAGRDEAELRSVPMVFGSALGDGEVLSRLLAGLRAREPLSPTQFHNSVHNAAAGYWSIGLASQAPTTALAAGDETLEVTLAEAGLQACIRDAPVAMVVAARAFPAMLQPACPALADFALAAWCVPVGIGGQWRCTVSSEPSSGEGRSLEAALREHGARGLAGQRHVRRLAATLAIAQ